MPADPPAQSPSVIAQLIQRVAAGIAPQVRAFAKEAGSSCNLPDCDALTLGTRCELCARRACIEHTYWKFIGAKPVPFCPYCVLVQHGDLFLEDDGGGEHGGPEEGGDGGPEEGGEG